jgi:hypothetical protein
MLCHFREEKGEKKCERKHLRRIAMSDKPTYKLDSNIVRTLLGAGLILLGILFLIGRYVGTRFDIDFGHYTWPLFILIPGLLLFVASFAVEPGRESPWRFSAGWWPTEPSAGPEYFRSLCYLGLCLGVSGPNIDWTGKADLRRSARPGRRGQERAKPGRDRVSYFCIAGLFFELGVRLSGFRRAAWLCWPVLLIGLGIVFCYQLAAAKCPSGNNEGEPSD